MSSEVSIALMARAPEPGRAKTRLIPSLGATGAARLHAAMTRHALSLIARCGLGATIWCEPGTDHPFFAECARDFGAILFSRAFFFFLLYYWFMPEKPSRQSALAFAMSLLAFLFAIQAYFIGQAYVG